MESYVELTKKLIFEMEEKGIQLLKNEKESLLKYAFYADDFEKVERLADHLVTAEDNSQILEEYEKEIRKKQEWVGFCVTLIYKCRDLILETYGLFDSAKVYCKENGLDKLCRLQDSENEIEEIVEKLIAEDKKEIHKKGGR